MPTFVFGKQQTGDIGSKGLIHDALSSDKHFLTLTGYRDWSKRFAAGLIASGFKPGDRLLLYSGNSFMFPVVLMGTVMAQGVFSAANPSYVARELAYQLKDTGARYLLTTTASLDVALEAADEINFPRNRVFAFDSGRETFDGTTKPVQGVRPWTDLIASPQKGESYRWPVITNRKDLNRLIVLNYSSGTTGVPKGLFTSTRVKLKRQLILVRRHDLALQLCLKCLCNSPCAKAESGLRGIPGQGQVAVFPAHVPRLRTDILLLQRTVEAHPCLRHAKV